METWFYGIDPECAEVKQSSFQVIKEIATIISVIRQNILYGMIIEPEIEMEKKIEKPVIVQA